MHRFLLVAGLLTIGATADAGAKLTYPVTVNTTARTASGDLGSARNSADTVQRISCYTYADSGACVAVDAANRVGVCVTSAPEMVTQIRSLNGDSYVSFSWDTASNCTSVLIYNTSYNQPKAP